MVVLAPGYSDVFGIRWGFQRWTSDVMWMVSSLSWEQKSGMIVVLVGILMYFADVLSLTEIDVWFSIYGGYLQGHPWSLL